MEQNIKKIQAHTLFASFDAFPTAGLCLSTKLQVLRFTVSKERKDKKCTSEALQATSDMEDSGHRKRLNIESPTSGRFKWRHISIRSCISKQFNLILSTVTEKLSCLHSSLGEIELHAHSLF